MIGLVKTAGGPVVAPGGESVATAYGRSWAGLVAGLALTGKQGETATVPTAGAVNSPVLVLVGLGSGTAETLSTEQIRFAAGTAARVRLNASSVALALPARDEDEIAAVTLGWRLGGHTFSRAPRKNAGATKDAVAKKSQNVAVSLLSPVGKQAAALLSFERAERLAVHTAEVRDWVNTPPNNLTPPLFAEAVQASVAAWRTAFDKEWKKAGASFEIEVFDEHQLADLQCGGILAVGAGSAAPPRMVRLTWTPASPVAHLALVGKGVTFDSGGLTIKPAGSMSDMKSDMAGAATVLNAARMAAELGLPVKVTAWAPMAENMVSGSSFRPGDVLTMHDGTTVEIRNTDAEGRLLLGDALLLAAAQEPDLVLDVATLTGHMVSALGDQITGVLGDDEVVARVLAAGEAAGEAMWPMPITREVRDRVRSSTIADVLQHDWVRWGGGLMAAAFLEQFTGGRPWAHLDIAGPSFVSAAKGHWTPGGTGVGLATLVAFAETMAQVQSSDPESTGGPGPLAAAGR